MRYATLLVKIAVWSLLMVSFLRFFTFSNDNSLSIQPDWYSGDQNNRGNGVYTLVGFSNPGFPIQIDGSSAEGKYWLAWTINYATAVVVGIVIAVLLYKIPIKRLS